MPGTYLWFGFRGIISRVWQWLKALENKLFKMTRTGPHILNFTGCHSCDAILNLWLSKVPSTLFHGTETVEFARSPELLRRQSVVRMEFDTGYSCAVLGLRSWKRHVDVSGECCFQQSCQAQKFPRNGLHSAVLWQYHISASLIRTERLMCPRLSQYQVLFT